MLANICINKLNLGFQRKLILYLIPVRFPNKSALNEYVQVFYGKFLV